MQLYACLLGFLLVLWWLRETMSFEEVFVLVCTGGETKKNASKSSSSRMFGILGVAMDVTTDLFFGLAVTGLVYFGPVVCAVFRSSAMMYQRSDDDYDENEDESNENEHNGKIIDGMFRFLFGHHRENAERYGRLVPIRDVLLAPFFEEFIFRGLLLTVLLGTGSDKGTTTSGSAAVSTRSAVYVSPLFFGFAHINHYFALKKVYGPAKASRFVLFQCIYTTAFGALAGTIFWRCKAGLAGAWSLHASMNAFGVPDFRPFRRRKTNAFEPPHFRRRGRNNSDDTWSSDGYNIGVKGKYFNAKINNWLERICYVLGPAVAREFVRSRIVV